MDKVTLEEATALLTEFESSDMETETDLDFGLADPGDAEETPDVNKSKAHFSLGP